jgi:hypothetical protein
MPTIGPERLQPRMLEMHLRRIFEFTERGAADPMFYAFFLESIFCVQRDSLEASGTISPGSTATEPDITDLWKIQKVNSIKVRQCIRSLTVRSFH